MAELPAGSIILWDGGSIPSGWALCDGAGGTPNLVDKFIRGASVDGDVNTGGGVETHTHTGPSATNTVAEHGHTAGPASGSNSPALNVVGGSGRLPASIHSHSWSVDIGNGGGHSHTVSATIGTTNNLPVHVKLYYIIKI